MYKLLLPLVTICVVIYSCNDSTFEDQNTETGQEYFPLEQGDTWIYEVDSTVYLQDGNEILQTTSQVREVITDKLTEEGDTYILTRSSRKSNEDEWKITDVYTIEKDEEKAFRTEDNRKFIKLVFPVRDGKDWDGNVFFDDNVIIDVFGNMLPIYQGWEYEMSTEPSVTILDSDYSDVVRVEHNDEDDGLTYSRSFEQYAKGHGLIFSELTYLSTQQLGSPEPWEEKAEQGLTIIKKLVSYN